MQVTIDIPDTLYRELEEDASSKHISVQQAAVLRLDLKKADSTESPVKMTVPVQLPLVRSTEPGTLDLTKNLNDAWFDDFHAA
jgi:hypothetical protein